MSDVMVGISETPEVSVAFHSRFSIDSHPSPADSHPSPAHPHPSPAHPHPSPALTHPVSGSTGAPDLSYMEEAMSRQGEYSPAFILKAEYFPFRDIIFQPMVDDALFRLSGVTIGKNFHWQQQEDQLFKGALLLRSDGKMISAINILPIEDYLESVVSSEMNANALPEFIKAHAIISRSWLLARMIEKRKSHSSMSAEMTHNTVGLDGMQANESADEHITWYDDSLHEGFDVCADDHCQRYQGLSRISNPIVTEAVAATSGLVLWHDGEICDTRFSKCCGGAFESFENCWQPQPHPYLKEGLDRIPTTPVPDLTIEQNAIDWITSSPQAFCNTTDRSVLQKVLNNYDLTTPDFFRWKKEYTQRELSEIVKTKSGIDFGKIKDIIPLQRGVSGRLVKVRLVGTKRSMTIGKELEIRRFLSKSHLYSSAFVVEKKDVGKDGVPGYFSLRGAGWGHGVGLCQIGAAIMAEKGYSFREILSHYYPGAEIKEMPGCIAHTGI